MKRRRKLTLIIHGMQQEKTIQIQLNWSWVVYAFFLPNNIGAINQYLNIIHGLVVTGGDFDIDPKLYGEKIKSTKIKTKKKGQILNLKLQKKQ